MPSYDSRYQQWLKIGGRLFLIVGQSEPMMALVVSRKSETEFTRAEQFETAVAPLENVIRPSRFVF